MIQIDLQPEIENQLAKQAKARGITFSDYVKELLERQAERSSVPEGRSIAAAIDGIRNLRNGNRIDGLKIKDLIHEGHKY